MIPIFNISEGKVVVIVRSISYPLLDMETFKCMVSEEALN